MWYRLAANVYLPAGVKRGNMQIQCDAMTPEQQSISVKLLDTWKPGNCEQELLQINE
jgi:hypothetical protein